MFAWWSRLVEKMRGTTPPTQVHAPAGAAAGVAAQPWAGPDLGGLSRAWQRFTARFHRRERQAAAPEATLETVLQRLTRLCDTFESHIARQQTRTDEIAAAIRKLAADLSNLPAAATEHKQRVEQLTEVVAAHREETARLGAMMTDMPTLLQRHADAITSEVVAVGRGQEHVAAKVDGVAGDMHRVSSTVQETTLAMTAFLKQHLSIEQEMTQTIRQGARRLTMMIGIAIGVASASACFGVIQLLTRLGAG